MGGAGLIKGGTSKCFYKFTKGRDLHREKFSKPIYGYLANSH